MKIPGRQDHPVRHVFKPHSSWVCLEGQKQLTTTGLQSIRRTCRRSEILHFALEKQYRNRQLPKHISQLNSDPCKKPGCQTTISLATSSGNQTTTHATNSPEW
ncbi:uncharacterized protein LOC144382509 [Halichoerus grypus]